VALSCEVRRGNTLFCKSEGQLWSSTSRHRKFEQLLIHNRYYLRRILLGLDISGFGTDAPNLELKAMWLITWLSSSSLEMIQLHNRVVDSPSPPFAPIVCQYIIRFLSLSA
jgi:hypothetical protein